jgi:hypothetical protein
MTQITQSGDFASLRTTAERSFSMSNDIVGVTRKVVDDNIRSLSQSIVNYRREMEVATAGKISEIARAEQSLEIARGEVVKNSSYLVLLVPLLLTGIGMIALGLGGHAGMVLFGLGTIAFSLLVVGGLYTRDSTAASNRIASLESGIAARQTDFELFLTAGTARLQYLEDTKGKLEMARQSWR